MIALYFSQLSLSPFILFFFLFGFLFDSVRRPIHVHVTIPFVCPCSNRFELRHEIWDMTMRSILIRLLEWINSIHTQREKQRDRETLTYTHRVWGYSCDTLLWAVYGSFLSLRMAKTHTKCYALQNMYQTPPVITDVTLNSLLLLHFPPFSLFLDISYVLRLKYSRIIRIAEWQYGYDIVSLLLLL